eukprot:5170489-Heterocapsa_arctica.AAC.1
MQLLSAREGVNATRRRVMKSEKFLEVTRRKQEKFMKEVTEHSQHAREVQAKQLVVRAAFLEAYGYPDGHDGLTFRQVLEVLAA